MAITQTATLLASCTAVASYGEGNAADLLSSGIKGITMEVVPGRARYRLVFCLILRCLSLLDFACWRRHCGIDIFTDRDRRRQ